MEMSQTSKQSTLSTTFKHCLSSSTMNPNPNFSTDFWGEFEFDLEPSLMELELSDYLMLDDHKIQGSNFNQEEYSTSSQSMISSEKYLLDGSSTNATSKRRNNDMQVIFNIKYINHFFY